MFKFRASLLLARFLHRFAGTTTRRQAVTDTPVAYVICRLDDIPSRKAKGFQLARIDPDGVERPWPIIVVRWGRHVFAYLNRCPHNGVALDWERNQFLDPDYGTRLMCGKHGARFDLATGLCVEGPCKGESLTPVASTILDGDICLTGIALAAEDES
jgi:nitrite reductase/ring-hydroxylating ferredoxin subunit